MSYPQSTAYTVAIDMYLTGTSTPATGKTVTVTISKAGAAFGNPSAGASNAAEVSSGVYSFALTTTDTNTTGDLYVLFSEATCDKGRRILSIVKATNGGLTAIPDTACTTNASLITSGSGTDQVTVSGGIASSDAKKINAVSTSSVTTINANVGTTQPQNFTGTGASALVKGDMVDVAGSAVNTAAAQLGVNVVQYNAQTAATGGDNLPKVSLYGIMGTLLTGTAANIAAAFSYVYNVASAAFTAASVNQTGDSFARLGAPTGASVSADIATVLTAVQNVQNNTFISTSIPMDLAVPASSSTTVQISVVFSDDTGAAKNLDSGNPIVTLVNDAGADKSGRLGAWSNPATGKYTINYTNTSTDALEGLHWDLSGTINSKLRRLPAYTQIVAVYTSTFTSADRTTLNAAATTAALSTLTTTVGAAGAGLTALGDARIANLDTNVGSRMATYTQPTGFLAATFPAGTVANTTNITAGTMTTTTNLTNAPSAGDFTAAMKTSLNNSTPAATIGGGAIAAIATSVAADLAGATIQLISPLSADGRLLELTTGDSYNTTNGQSLTFNNPGRSALIGTTPHLRLSGMGSDLTVAPALSDTTSPIVFNGISVAATSTAFFISPFVNGVNQYSIKYQIRFEDGSGNIATLIQGVCTVSEGF